MIKDYIRPKSLEEAYELLSSNKNSRILGGGAFLRLGSKRINTAIDLCDLDLNYIKETDEGIEIGAMTTFRDLEKSQILKEYFGNLLADALKGIVGVQFRNYVTVGASVYSKYGFSDLITALLALDCTLVLYKNGEIKLEDYLNTKLGERDILTKIVLKKEKTSTSYQTIRKSTSGYPTLSVAVAKNKDGFKISVGARPMVAALAQEAADFLNTNSNIDEDTALKAGEICSESLKFGTNYLGTEEYRKDICKVLVKRAIMEVV